jgi:hypothetical protein
MRSKYFKLEHFGISNPVRIFLKMLWRIKLRQYSKCPNPPPDRFDPAEGFGGTVKKLQVQTGA